MGENESDFELNNENLDDSVVAEEHMGDAVKKLKEKLKGAEEKVKEYLDELQRAKADFVNMRKRDEEAKAEFVKFAKSDVVTELIPILDALDLAVSHGEKGVENIQKLMLKTLKQHGLEETSPAGETFDPAFHEAVGMIATDKKNEDHKVLEVMQKGYILSGKVLRPAKVRVGEWQE